MLKKCTGKGAATSADSTSENVADEPSQVQYEPPQLAEDTPEKAFLRREARCYSNLQAATKKKIKRLQQARRRLLQKVAHVQDVINDLVGNSFSSFTSY